MRPRLWITSSPCQGSAALFVNPLASSASLNGNPVSSPWPSINSSLWNATKSYATNELNVQLQFASYFITILGAITSPPTPADASVNFTLHVRLEAPTAAVPQYPPLWNPVITTQVVTTDQLLLPGDTMSMTVLWNSSAVTARQYSYRVYYARSDVTAPGAALAAAATTLPCAISSDTVSAADGSLLPGVAPVYASPDRCVITTACGVQSTATPAGDWFSASGGGQPIYTTVSGLAQQTAYSFQVLVKDPASGAIAAYAATRGTPTYTKVAAATSSSTMGAVAGAATGAFACILVAAWFIKRRINKQVHERAKYHPVNNSANSDQVAADRSAASSAVAPSTQVADVSTNDAVVEVVAIKQDDEGPQPAEYSKALV